MALRFVVALAVLPAVALGVPSREVVLWLDARDASNATWAGWTSAMAAHRANVTGAAPLLYAVSDVGVFESLLPNATAIAVADGWMRAMRSSVALRVKPLVLASAAGIAQATTNATVGAALISATVAEVARLGLDGLDLRLSEAGTASLRTPFLALLGAWLAAFDAAGAQLGLLIPGNCTAGQAPQWLGATCADLKSTALNASHPHPNLRVISEATIGAAPPAAWTAGVNAAEHGLGPSVLCLGVSYAPPLEDPDNGCLMYALAGGITSLYVRGGIPAQQRDWDSFGYWMNTIA